MTDKTGKESLAFLESTYSQVENSYELAKQGKIGGLDALNDSLHSLQDQLYLLAEKFADLAPGIIEFLNGFPQLGG